MLLIAGGVILVLVALRLFLRQYAGARLTAPDLPLGGAAIHLPFPTLVTPYGRNALRHRDDHHSPLYQAGQLLRGLGLHLRMSGQRVAKSGFLRFIERGPHQGAADAPQVRQNLVRGHLTDK